MNSYYMYRESGLSIFASRVTKNLLYLIVAM